jgi:hypothetical protein
LPNQRLRHNQENALGSFSAALSNHQAGFDRFAQPDFVGEDAAAFAETTQRKDHSIDLVRVRIDPRLTLGRSVALAIIRTADPNQILGEHPKIEIVQGHLS